MIKGCKYLLAALALAVAMGTVAAKAQETTSAPLSSQTARPNLYLLLDTSGSMGYDDFGTMVGEDSVGTIPTFKWRAARTQCSNATLCRLWEYSLTVTQTCPSRMALAKNALAPWNTPATGDLTLVTPWMAPDWLLNGMPPPSGWPASWTFAAATGFPQITITHTATTHTYKFTAHYNSYRPDPGYPISLVGHLGSPTGTCATLDTTNTWYGPLYSAPGCAAGTEWGSGASVVPPQDLIGQTAGQVNWGLISFGGTCTDPVYLRVPVNSWDTGDVSALESMLKLAGYGGLGVSGFTPTRGALNFAKTQLQSTFNLDPNITCGRTYGVVVLAGGLSNTCNPYDGSWIFPCGVPPYDCDGATSGYDCDRRMGAPRNYTAFPPGVAEQIWDLNLTRDGSPVVKPRVWVVSVGNTSNPCEFNFLAYMGRTDANAPGGDWGFDTAADAARFPQWMGDESHYAPMEGNYAAFALTSPALHDALQSMVGAMAPVAPPEASEPVPADGASPCPLAGLSWTAPAGATRYDVFVDGVKVCSDLAAPTCDPGGLSGGRHEWYVVSNSLGACTTGPTWHFTLGTPDTPSELSATGVCRAVSLSWQGAAGAESYEVLRGSNCGSLSVLASGLLVTTYEDTTAVPGTTYRYAVRGLNGCGSSASSSCVAAAPNPLPTITGGYLACSNEGLALSTQAFASYQWTRDGADIPGATAQSYTTHVGGTHKVRTTDTAGCVQSSVPLLVYIDPSPQPTIEGSPVGCVSTGAPLTTQNYLAYWWYKDGVLLSGATGRSYTATAPGSYTVRVSDGCPGTSPPVTVTLNDPQPTVTGDVANACPAIRVALQADPGYATYQWRRNGTPLPGAGAVSYSASLSGSYSVQATDNAGCTGTSPDHAVTVTFCPASEVSPEGSVFPARLVKDTGSPTGYYLYFQRLDGALGYSLYEGTIGTWYSHGSAPGNVCNLSATDLGTGEMQAAVTPTDGGHYYFVTAFNESVEGPSGYATSGAEVDPLQSSCGP